MSLGVILICLETIHERNQGTIGREIVLKASLV